MTILVYILASRYRGTMYTEVTEALGRRMLEHREDSGSEFTSKYDVLRLVYVEPHERHDEAQALEQRIKRWRREWKFRLIEQVNPAWEDLFDRLNR